MIKDNTIYRLVVGSIIFLFLFAIDSYIMDKIVKPKLSKLEIVSPVNGKDVSNLFTDIEVNVRAVEDKLVYVVVETPQGSLWTQDKLFPKKFKDKLDGRARLGEGEVGIGGTFKIFAIATKENLPIGLLVKIPPDAIHSNTVTVRRVG